jgi:hypothetical protein
VLCCAVLCCAVLCCAVCRYAAVYVNLYTEDALPGECQPL